MPSELLAQVGAGEILTQLGAFAPGFAVAIYLLIQNRADHARHAKERREVRDTFVAMTERMLDAIHKLETLKKEQP